MDETDFLDNIIGEELLDQLTDSMVILDAENRITFFNQSALKLQHIAKNPLRIGASFLDIVVTERLEIVKSILNQVRRSHRPQISEFEFKAPDGRSFFFEMTYHPILAEEAAKERICIVSHDITHQKTFERKSVQLIQELSSLIENASAIIFSIDSREYITEWNKECVRVTGNEKNEVYTKKIYNYLDERCHRTFTELVQKVLGGEPVNNAELQIKNNTGGITTILANATPKINAAQHVIGILIVGQDITELTQYRKSLEEKVKDRTEKLKQAIEKEKELVEIKNKFVSVASHEFRIPLSSIGGYVKTVKTNPHLREADRISLQSIESQVAHMKSLLDDILTIKKNETTVLNASVRPLELIAFLLRLVDEVLTGVNHSHQFKTEFPEDEISIHSDEKLLRNIFINLFSNAIKFSPGHNEISLSVVRHDMNIEITVRDKGIGIASDDLKKLFEPFHRGANAADIKGTGLGLYIAKKAVETLKGEMTVSSVVDSGTSITVRFPIYQ